MEDIRRWSVTYTKHIRQKRKVYQDGLLELHTSTGKVMLYDDCEKLLYCKVLKKEEVIRPGETLTFDTCLIDIGDPEGDHKILSDLNSQGKNEKIMENSRLSNGQTLRKNSVFTEKRKFNSEKNKTPSINLSPSQRIIREFKKSELHKYGTLPSSPDTPKSTVTEWQALYTTQITQKAKKYHDGFLRLSIGGSQGRQVMLYDASKKLLDSRFLKKDEVIRSGESLTFDAHLVDVGEPEGNHKPVMGLNVQGINCKEVGESGILHGEQNNSKTSKAVLRKWNALYTTQITQKSKKYQSGILRLVSCGSYQMQVTLLNEEGSTLSSKFLALSVDVRTGSTIELPKYLVEVGEPWTNLEGEAQNNGCLGKEVNSDLDNIQLSRRVPIIKPSHGDAQNNGCLGKEVDSDLDKIKFSRRVTINKPLRGTHEILSILKKPITQESVSPTRKAPVEQGLHSQSSDLVHLDIQDAYVQQSNVSKTSAMEDHEDEFKVLNEGTNGTHTYKNEIPESKALHTDTSFDFIKLEDSDNKVEPESKDSTSSGFNPGSSTSNILRPKFDVGHSDRSIMDSTSFIERLQAYCRSDAVILDFSEENQPPSGSKPHEELTSSKEIDECPNFDLGF
ncbi:hypothetical protein VitviT2T_001840 [Vitis vinifera]|uniref:5'-3' DNA helicase ZGRF1-like N-terminal domain-containing protein n=2 Tax=Vitis vinifera TaxID=29760 RepID=A0ABY9BGP1_VITVI|nr:uncharacterized protein LOC104881368 isoform X1 [Vitis vinifera]WJZ82047.1 hypothetical protein VitviT2T_001840 [Vitis vinifera]|eukprot:XP_010659692.1 PREDICTED: uncharacterized protein LOC104881368 isoform X2 [Vitis vinifera]